MYRPDLYSNVSIDESVSLNPIKCLDSIEIDNLSTNICMLRENLIILWNLIGFKYTFIQSDNVK